MSILPRSICPSVPWIGVKTVVSASALRVTLGVASEARLYRWPRPTGDWNIGAGGEDDGGMKGERW